MTELTAACLTHRRTSLDLLARLPRGDALTDRLPGIGTACGAAGVLGISTCNRFELYLSSQTPLTAQTAARAIAGISDLPTDMIVDRLELLCGEDALRHLFMVAGGLDSRIVGEAEILGQVRAAVQAAAAAGTLNGDLPSVAQWAVRAGRRIRRASGVSVAPSAADHAVKAVDRMLGQIEGRQVLVIGAGRMGRRAVRSITSAGATAVVCTRSPARATPTLQGQQVLPLSAIPDLLPDVDAVICATDSATPVLTAAALQAARNSSDRPVCIVDLSVPHNVERACAKLPGVVLIDLDSLPTCDAPTADAVANADVDAIIDDELDAYAQWRCTADIAVLIREVTSSAERARVAEVSRVAARAGDAQPLIEEVTRRLMNKLLHDIVTGIRRRAALGDIAGARALAALATSQPVEDAADNWIICDVEPFQDRHSLRVEEGVA